MVVQSIASLKNLQYKKHTEKVFENLPLHSCNISAFDL